MCKVRGIDINVNKALLEEILKMSSRGTAPTSHSDREASFRLILGREVNPLNVISTSQLSAEVRLLHNIISRILFPKMG